MPPFELGRGSLPQPCTPGCRQLWLCHSPQAAEPKDLWEVPLDPAPPPDPFPESALGATTPGLSVTSSHVHLQGVDCAGKVHTSPTAGGGAAKVGRGYKVVSLCKTSLLQRGPQPGLGRREVGLGSLSWAPRPVQKLCGIKNSKATPGLRGIRKVSVLRVEHSSFNSLAAGRHEMGASIHTLAPDPTSGANGHRAHTKSVSRCSNRQCGEAIKRVVLGLEAWVPAPLCPLLTIDLGLVAWFPHL